MVVVAAGHAVEEGAAAKRPEKPSVRHQDFQGTAVEAAVAGGSLEEGEQYSQRKLML